MNTLKDLDTFLDAVNTSLSASRIDRQELAMLDHVCYRVETDDRYRELRYELGKTALLIDESDVAGRPIATFEFEEPVEAGGWRVPYLELPASKAGSLYAEGFEHAEFVVIGDVRKFAARHGDVQWVHKERVINPELSMTSGSISLKFHEQPLGAVVRIEQRLAKGGK